MIAKNPKNKIYLREVLLPDERIVDHYMIVSKLEIFAGSDAELEKDCKHWIDNGAYRVSYFKLEAYRMEQGKG
jgi:hypothetical protein